MAQEPPQHLAAHMDQEQTGQPDHQAGEQAADQDRCRDTHGYPEAGGVMALVAQALDAADQERPVAPGGHRGQADHADQQVERAREQGGEQREIDPPVFRVIRLAPEFDETRGHVDQGFLRAGGEHHDVRSL